jgi:hypothetical protein
MLQGAKTDGPDGNDFLLWFDARKLRGVTMTPEMYPCQRMRAQIPVEADANLPQRKKEVTEVKEIKEVEEKENRFDGRILRL